MPVRTLSGHESKLSSASVSKDTKYIITTSFDRSFRLWEKKDIKLNESAHLEAQDAEMKNQ